MSDEVFTFSARHGRDRKIDVSAVYVAATAKYEARYGSSITGEGDSLAEALHELADQIGTRGMFGGNTMATRQDLALRQVACRYCGSAIVFGKTKSNRWVPLEAEQVRGHLLPHDVITMKVIRRDPITDTPTFARCTYPHGWVWVVHNETCGARPDEPVHEELRSIWQRNRARFDERQQHAIADLFAMRDRLSALD